MWGATTRWTGNSCELRVGMAPTDLNPIKPIEPLYYIYAHKYCENQHKRISTHTMEKIQVIWSHVTLGSRTYSILSVFIFLSLIKAQRIRLNNWKTMNNNETWWKKVKTNETNMTNTTKTMKHTEKKSTQWKASKYIYIYFGAMSRQGLEKFYLFRFFIF